MTSYGKSLRCILGSSQSFLLLAGYHVALQGRVLHRVDGEVCGVVILGALCCMATVGSAVGRGWIMLWVSWRSGEERLSTTMQ